MPEPATFQIPAIAREIAAQLHAGKRFVFSTHVYPDGDNLGSMTALMHALRRLGKECQAYVGTKVPDYYGFLPDVENLVGHAVPSESPEAFDAVIIVDSGDVNRMGPPFTEWMAQGNIPLINIDHHKSNTYFGTVNWVDPGYAAVGEQIVELLEAMEVPLDQEIATCLMCSIMTDTGRFSFENTNLRTMTYATRLVAAGCSTYSVFAPVYQSKPFTGLKLQNLAIGTLQVDESRRLAILWLTQEMLRESGALLEESEGIIDVVNAIDGVNCVCFIKEANPGDFKLSIRTKGAMDAVPIATMYGGGGHARAAGSTLPVHTLSEVLARVVPMIRANVDRQLGRTESLAAE